MLLSCLNSRVMQNNQQPCRCPDFQARLRRQVPRPQFERFQKCLTEPLYLLRAEEEDIQLPSGSLHPNELLRFYISGSTQTKHTVTINIDGNFACSCQDARIHGKKYGYVCKHACFVLFRVMRLPSTDIFNAKKLNSDELCVCAELIAHRMAIQESEFHPTTTTSNEQLGMDFTRPFRITGEDDECPVCYNAILPASEADPLRGCPDCGHALHRECARKWQSSAPKKTCVMCRSTVWSKWNGS